jgi:hypothetical protein
VASSFVDEKLHSLKEIYPKEKIPMPSGKLPWGLYPTPPTSGNAFSRWLLDHILPMPKPEYKVIADFYLIALAAVYGEVLSINKVLGYYRIHGDNFWWYETPNIKRLVQQLRVWNSQISVSKKASLELGENLKSRYFREVVKAEMALAILAPNELIAMRLSANRLKIACHGVLSLFDDPYTPSMWAKILLGGWFLVTAVLPRPIAIKLAIMGFFPAARPAWLARVLDVEAKSSAKGELDVQQ